MLFKFFIKFDDLIICTIILNLKFLVLDNELLLLLLFRQAQLRYDLEVSLQGFHSRLFIFELSSQNGVVVFQVEDGHAI